MNYLHLFMTIFGLFWLAYLWRRVVLLDRQFDQMLGIVKDMAAGIRGQSEVMRMTATAIRCLAIGDQGEIEKALKELSDEHSDAP